MKTKMITIALLFTSLAQAYPEGTSMSCLKSMFGKDLKVTNTGLHAFFNERLLYSAPENYQGRSFLLIAGPEGFSTNSQIGIHLLQNGPKIYKLNWDWRLGFLKEKPEVESVVMRQATDGSYDVEVELEHDLAVFPVENDYVTFHYRDLGHQSPRKFDAHEDFLVMAFKEQIEKAAGVRLWHENFHHLKRSIHLDQQEIESEYRLVKNSDFRTSVTSEGWSAFNKTEIYESEMKKAFVAGLLRKEDMDKRLRVIRDWREKHKSLQGKLRENGIKFVFVPFLDQKAIDRVEKMTAKCSHLISVPSKDLELYKVFRTYAYGRIDDKVFKSRAEFDEAIEKAGGAELLKTPSLPSFIK